MTTDTLLAIILVATIASLVRIVLHLDALRDDIADVERLVRRVADEMELDADED